jgi:EAL domain-containing protein (putative c-di-GMP-specific phosphodiesterase class I)
MQDGQEVVERLHALKELGVRLAIDDFGTGYSSLRYLSRFRVDILKIAKPFVDGIGRQSPEEAALSRAIVDLGNVLELQTVAEGIEQAEQETELQGLGCRLGQGFLFARPLDATALGALLAERRGESGADAGRAVA